MTKFTLVYETNSPTMDEEWSLHKTGCKDITRGAYRAMNEDPRGVAGDTWQEALANWHDEEMVEMGWTVDYTRVMGCAVTS